MADAASQKMAQQFKDKGNLLFKKGKYEEAIRNYKDAITTIDSEIMTTSDDLKASCLLNLAVSIVCNTFFFLFHHKAIVIPHNRP